MNRLYYESEISKKIIESDCIIIYGARIVAQEVATCLIGSPYNKKIEAFMVSEKEGNPERLLGRPVITINEGKEKYSNALIIVAVLERYLDEIENTLVDNGMTNIILCGFESDLWSGLRGNFFREIAINKYGIYKTFEEEINKCKEYSDIQLGIYSAKCHVDRELSDKRQYPWEKQIQVGSALTDKVVCDIQDNTGDNISEKNKYFCELTALYWIWKNDKSAYKGLGHYRRHFDLSGEGAKKLGMSGIDVILPIPIMNFPSVRKIYEHDHIIEDWDIMMDVLKEQHIDYYDTALRLQDGIYYYAYNMLIAKKDIFDEYCDWLFPILFECEKRCKPKEDTYQGRYMGFLSERLLSVFFIHNWERWNIVHAKKNFLN